MTIDSYNAPCIINGRGSSRFTDIGAGAMLFARSTSPREPLKDHDKCRCERNYSPKVCHALHIS